MFPFSIYLNGIIFNFLKWSINVLVQVSQDNAYSPVRPLVGYPWNFYTVGDKTFSYRIQIFQFHNLHQIKKKHDKTSGIDCMTFGLIISR